VVRMLALGQCQKGHDAQVAAAIHDGRADHPLYRSAASREHGGTSTPALAARISA
jgi:hypothetical protein